MDYRIERDSMGEIKVPQTKKWGAQTQRSLENFKIGSDKMPLEIIYAIALIKKAAAESNISLCPDKMSKEQGEAIKSVCDKILAGELDSEFPLSVWQTGSGTHTNMNVNEVIANVANEAAGENFIHPNDHVNMSQSSNDVFPSAMHIAAVKAVTQKLLPSLYNLIKTLIRLEKENEDVLKIGRTHLQDAVPITFAQEISGFKNSLEKARELIGAAVTPLLSLAIGGSAVGTGLNVPYGFDIAVCELISAYTLMPFTPMENKFHGLTSKNELVFAHGAVKALACDLFKIANDIRFLASGPRCAYSEITISQNEPGSSIMPGKVNPTQCEALTQVCIEIMGNDAAISFAASQGNFELNVYMPLIAHNFLRSVNLLSDAIESFNSNCVGSIKANRDRMQEYLNNSLMLVTALNTSIGYEKAAKTAQKAYAENKTLKEACLELGFLSEKEFDKIVDPNKMV